MILNFHSRLGHAVSHPVIPVARNWFRTIEHPRIEFWRTKDRKIYLIAGEYAYRFQYGTFGEKGHWITSKSHSYDPPKYLGSQSYLQWTPGDCTADFMRMSLFNRSPYESIKELEA